MLPLFPGGVASVWTTPLACSICEGLAAMEVSDELFALAERLERSYGPSVLAMRLDSRLGRDRLVVTAREVVGFLAGGEAHWSVDLEADGVVVRQWGFVPDIDETLRTLSRALDERGVEGRLLAHQPEPRPARMPLLERDEELLECHARVRGERRTYVPEWELRRAEQHGREPAPAVEFRPDASALLAGIEAALVWSGRPPPGAQLRSTSGLHRDVDEVRAYLAYGFAEAGSQWWRVSPSRWWWESDDAFRLSCIRPSVGDVSFAQGGAGLAQGDWRPAHAALLDELRAASRWGSYGLIKRGRRPIAVGSSLTYDWLPAFHFGMYNLDHHLYEDVLAPDAFGAQLLGPGYAGRIPDGHDWERAEVGDDAVLLLHRDPAAWFANPLPPITTEDSMLRNPSYPIPEVVLRARDDFAEILITYDVVTARPLDPLAR